MNDYEEKEDNATWINVRAMSMGRVVTLVCRAFCILFSCCDTHCAALGHYGVHVHMQARVTMRISRRRCQRYTSEAVM